MKIAFLLAVSWLLITLQAIGVNSNQPITYHEKIDIVGKLQDGGFNDTEQQMKTQIDAEMKKAFANFPFHLRDHRKK